MASYGGNGIAIFGECKATGGHIQHTCHQGTCGHTCETVPMERTGSFVAFMHSCVHMSLYPKDGHVVIAQFFFRLKGRCRRLYMPHFVGSLSSSTCAHACEDIAVLPQSHIRYQGIHVKNTVVLSDMNALTLNMSALKCAAETHFAAHYNTPVETHTIWVIHKENGHGGFSKHVDTFLPSCDHFGTLSVRIGP